MARVHCWECWVGSKPLHLFRRGRPNICPLYQKTRFGIPPNPSVSARTLGKRHRGGRPTCLSGTEREEIRPIPRGLPIRSGATIVTACQEGCKRGQRNLALLALEPLYFNTP